MKTNETKAKLDGRIDIKTKQLGNSDLFITPVGFGAWAIGGSGWEFGWGEQDDKASVAAIHRALEFGVNWIDTAAVYGMGHSEEVVALALRTWTGRRPYVFTKCGLRWDEQGYVHRSLAPDSICRECEDSLRRLNVDHTLQARLRIWADAEVSEDPAILEELPKTRGHSRTRHLAFLFRVRAFGWGDEQHTMKCSAREVHSTKAARPGKSDPLSINAITAKRCLSLDTSSGVWTLNAHSWYPTQLREPLC